MIIKTLAVKECPICGEKGSVQVFFNKADKIKYARIRHYILKGEKGYNPKVKYNFQYCKIDNLKQLETLLLSLNFQYPQTQAKNVGQLITLNNVEQNGMAKHKIWFSKIQALFSKTRAVVV
jgi:hypothetical protein